MIVRNGKPTKTKSTKPLIPKNKKTLTKESFDPLRIDCPPTDNIAYARFAMVGEAPSNVEVLEGQPFVGPSGAQLNRIIAAAQLPRYEIYLTNACKTQLPKNNSDVLWTSKGYRHPKWGELQKALIEELSHFKGKFIHTPFNFDKCTSNPACQAWQREIMKVFPYKGFHDYNGL